MAGKALVSDSPSASILLASGAALLKAAIRWGCHDASGDDDAGQSCVSSRNLQPGDGTCPTMRAELRRLTWA